MPRAKKQPVQWYKFLVSSREQDWNITPCLPICGSSLCFEVANGVESVTIWKHFLHKEDKSLGPDATPCHEYTRGLLLRRPVVAMLPFEYIGKEIERSAQEGEDPSMLESSGPIRYGARQRAKTRPADVKLIERAKKYSKKALRRESGVSQHAVDRFCENEKVHPGTRAKLEKAVHELELAEQHSGPK